MGRWGEKAQQGLDRLASSQIRTTITIEYIAASCNSLEMRSISIYIAIVRGEAGPGLVRAVRWVLPGLESGSKSLKTGQNRFEIA